MNKEKAVKTYKDIAREAGYCVFKSSLSEVAYYWWHEQSRWASVDYSTQEEAWKACCVDNGLIGE